MDGLCYRLARNRLEPESGEEVLRRFREQVYFGDSLCLREVQGSSGEPLAQTMTTFCSNNGDGTKQRNSSVAFECGTANHTPMLFRDQYRRKVVT